MARSLARAVGGLPPRAGRARAARHAMTLLVGMVADDLTGALDAAAPFADRGLRTIVIVSPQGVTDANARYLDDAEVICINTASREISEQEAGRRVTAATAALKARSPQLFYKKVDSRLKGHLVAELRAMLVASDCDDIVLAPAIPDLGRVVVAGAVRGVGVENPIVIAERCGDLPLRAPDTPDSDSLVKLGGQIGATTLAAGARGFAIALAARFPIRKAEVPPHRLPQPALIAIGSRDPITRAQIDHAIRESAVTRVFAPNGEVPMLTSKSDIMLVTAEVGAIVEDGALVAARFAEGIADMVQNQPPASLFMSGGETAFAILVALGVGVIRLGGEALPGIPFASAEIGGRQVVILTKSGGFGHANTISLLVGTTAELD